ncbi:hypothetical protein [Bacillus cereus]|uniref:hypothetical protein n=1 Tax=Bacillus cereus TaxID=1396 RepID=UPI001D0D56B7|nr:hypothetical protein [Bacillus cereus]
MLDHYQIFLPVVLFHLQLHIFHPHHSVAIPVCIVGKPVVSKVDEFRFYASLFLQDKDAAGSVDISLGSANGTKYGWFPTMQSTQ